MMSKTHENLGLVYHCLMMSGFFAKNPKHKIIGNLLFVLIDNGNSSLKIRMNDDGTIQMTAHHIKLKGLFKRPPMTFDPIEAPAFVDAFIRDYYQECILFAA